MFLDQKNTCFLDTSKKNHGKLTVREGATVKYSFFWRLPWGKAKILIFFSLKFDSFTLKHILSHCEGSQNAFCMPFTPPMFQKYSSIMRAVCAVSEISIHYESSLCYFRYIHLLWEWLGLFQKYIPLWEACAILEIYSTMLFQK